MMFSNKFIRFLKGMCGTADAVMRVAADNCDQALLADNGVADRHHPAQSDVSVRFRPRFHRYYSLKQTALSSHNDYAFGKHRAVPYASRQKFCFGSSFLPGVSISGGATFFISKNLVSADASQNFLKLAPPLPYGDLESNLASAFGSVTGALQVKFSQT